MTHYTIAAERPGSQDTVCCARSEVFARCIVTRPFRQARLLPRVGRHPRDAADDAAQIPQGIDGGNQTENPPRNPSHHMTYAYHTSDIP